MPSSTSYDSLTLDTWNGAVTVGSDAIWVMLVNGYSPNSRTHSKRSDVTGEVVGTGYSAGGMALSGVTLTLDNSVNDRTTATATNPAWTTSTITATGAVFYKHRGGAASADNLISYVDFGGTVSSTAATFTITSISSSGFLNNNKV